MFVGKWIWRRARVNSPLCLFCSSQRATIHYLVHLVTFILYACFMVLSTHTVTVTCLSNHCCHPKIVSLLVTFPHHFKWSQICCFCKYCMIWMNQILYSAAKANILGRKNRLFCFLQTRTFLNHTEVVCMCLWYI